jgi:putative ABC transport system permease protein
MLKNYFKTAWRNLIKNKFYSIITIAGLTAALCVGIVILLWVQDETSFDSFHSKASNLYKLENRVGTGNSIQIWQNTASPIGKLGAEELPEVKGYTRTCYNYFYDQFKTGDKTIYQKESYFVDPSFFSLFDFALIKGNKENPFPDNQSVVLTESVAKKYFGDADPIGKVLVAEEDTTNFTVTGVIADFPRNSAFNYEMMFPLSLYASKIYGPGKKNGMTIDTDFNDYNYNTFLWLSPTVSLKDLSTKLRNIHLRIRPEDTDVDYLMLPVGKMHLYKSDGTDAGMETVRMFTIVAVLILVIGCINYVNLSTARSMLRSREVSLRKIVGAGKLQLFLQFVLETVVLFFIASVAAIALIPLLLPVFNSISGKYLQFDMANMSMWMVIGGCVLATLIVSSIYPALLLSSFEPLKALKGKAALRINDVVFRKALVVVQFAFSVILIAGTFVIGRQLNFIRSKNLGYDKENVLSFNMRYMGKHYDAVKANLMKQPGVLDITRSNNEQIVSYNGQTGNNEFDGKQVGETLMIYPVPVDKNYIPFFKIDMAAGKNFEGLPADSIHFILNETAVRNARIKDPIGKRFKLREVDGIITGVVKDFHFASMRKAIEPVVFYYRPNQFYRIHIKTTGKDAAKVIAAAEMEWKKYNPQYPFEYTFLDDTFNQLYETETRTGTLFNIFAGIAILISCLGLLGLTAYTAQLRTREIGVRKVLGASVSGVVILLAKDFLRLVFVGIAVAIPVAWFVMNRWMQDFAYRTDINWTVFLMSGLLAILIALITISFQSVKAALVNPVRSLKQAD